MWRGDGESLEKMGRYRALIVGSGKIAGLYDSIDGDYTYSHAKAYSQNGDVELVCCCDLDISKAKELSKKYNIENFSNDFLDAIEIYHPDIVSICTPDNTHFKVTISILDLDAPPKVIFLEKPACRDRDELNSLIEISNKRGVAIVVNHSRRFDPLHQSLKMKIADGYFGEVIRVDAIYYSGWQHNGIHTVDTLNFLFSEGIDFEKLLNISDSPYVGDYNLDFMCRLERSGALTYITAVDERYYQLFEFDLKFERGRVKIEDFGSRVRYEEVTINHMGERVLVERDLDISLYGSSPMESAVDKIVAYLKGEVELVGYLIGDISDTMSIIWRGLSWVR